MEVCPQASIDTVGQSGIADVERFFSPDVPRAEARRADSDSTVRRGLFCQSRGFAGLVRTLPPGFASRLLPALAYWSICIG